MSQKTLKPSTIFCHDNLPVLRGINSDTVDLIYLDPPFNKGRNFHAPIGTTAEGAEFQDIWTPSDVKDEWHNELNDRYPRLYGYLNAVGDIGSRSAKYYLIYMAVRLLEIHRILKTTGSIYLHCDPTASHYLKLLLDTIFGYKYFRNEIIWSYRTGGVSKRYWPRKHDILFCYGKSDTTLHIPLQEKIYYDKPFFGVKQDSGGYYTDVYVRDVWDIPAVINVSKERIGYPTQKPLALLERIIKASSNEGDLVLDPFCGCATTCVAAERLGRRWVGIDVSRRAYELVKMRLQNEVPADLFSGEPLFREDFPTRTDGAHTRKFSVADRNRKYGEQDGKCAGCHVNFAQRNLTIDHIIPLTKGGGNEYDNLQLLCGNCNSVKGARPMEYLRARLKTLYGINGS